jgi:CheY-like chemotaxis protein
MNGLETLAKIKSMPLLSLVPVVMYSTSPDPLLIKQSHEGGVAKFITKPSSFEGIIDLPDKSQTNICKISAFIIVDGLKEFDR